MRAMIVTFPPLLRDPLRRIRGRSLASGVLRKNEQSFLRIRLSSADVISAGH